MTDANTWNRRLTRFRSMDRRELFDRARQFSTARLDLLRYRLDHEFARDPSTESSTRTGHFFFTPQELPSLYAVLKQLFPAQATAIVSQAERICRHRFDLLGYENLDYGPEIDWHRDVVHGKSGPRKPWFNVKYLDFEEVGDSKITWELNRHQHFVTLAKAFGLTGDGKFIDEILAQWTQWHKENPYPIGINWASSLEVGYRSLSWIWTFFLLRDSPLFTIEFRKQWTDALALSGRHIETYLSTYFSPNTHLLGEALALFFIGTLFPSLQSSMRWQESGWRILQQEASKQVRDDGFYFEQSTYYHVYALDIFLHARVLAGLNRIEVSPAFDDILQRMLGALCLLGRAGLPPSLGDDDGGRLFDSGRHLAEHMLDPLTTGSALYQRGDFKGVAGGPREETLWLLGTKVLAEWDSLPIAKCSGKSSALPDSGYYLMADEISQQQLVIDAGALGAGSGGHGHADALSVTLAQKGRSLLLDPGTFEYVGDGGDRQRLRGTGAHNTLQVDQRDQAGGAGPFSWHGFPHVKVDHWITGRQFDLFQGSHDGYSRLQSPVIHRRWVFHRKGEFFMVRDLAEGRGLHQLDIAWHVGPSLSSNASRPCLFEDERWSLDLIAVDDPRWSQTVNEEYWSPAYGRKERANVIKFSASLDLPADFATVVVAGVNVPNNHGQLVRILEDKEGAVCGYRYSNLAQEHNFFFADATTWALGEWASDAEFLYWTFDREKERYSLILSNGTYACARGRRVVTCSQRVSYAEIAKSGSRVEMFSSQPEHVMLELPLDCACPETEFDRRSDPKGMGL